MKGSDALYPSIYYKSRFTEEERSGMAKYIVNVTRTWLNYTGDIHKPIYVYTQTMMEFDNDGLPVYYDDVSLICSSQIATICLFLRIKKRHVCLYINTTVLDWGDCQDSNSEQ